VIGAGLSALAFARALGDAAEIRLFEKSRGYGGRMATRRCDGFQFDHGARFFTARSETFRSFLRPYLEAGVVARWDARFVEFEGNRLTARGCWSAEHPHYVAVPGMNALARALGESLNVELCTRVDDICRADGDWLLRDDAGRDLGCFDWVVSSVTADRVCASRGCRWLQHTGLLCPDAGVCATADARLGCGANRGVSDRLDQRR
jgi:predicted NAD/FAD-dependent oxidoreductase